MKHRTVIFYTSAGKRSPVEEWLDGLDDSRAQAILMGVKFFEEYPNPIVPTKFFEKVDGAEIWEIKCHYGKEQYRLLAFQDANSIIIATLGFAKKTQRLPRREVDLAEARRKEYLKQKQRGHHP